MSRAEHLAWCKKRALEYLPDDPRLAFQSMMSDLGKHEETRDHGAMTLGLGLLLSGNLDKPEECRKFIEGFN